LVLNWRAGGGAMPRPVPWRAWLRRAWLPCRTVDESGRGTNQGAAHFPWCDQPAETGDERSAWLSLIGAGQRPQMAEMNKFAIIAALVFTASPAAAQSATPNGQVQSSTQSGATVSTQTPATGVFCIEEMTATFCNVVTGPNTGGYGARSGSGSTGSTGSIGLTGGSTGGLSTGQGGSASSIPSCPAEPPFNELCN
jgi:hypothetical protein